MFRPKNTSLKLEEAKRQLRLAAAEEPVLLKSIREVTRSYPKTGLLAGFAAGLILGASGDARRMVKNLLSSLLTNASLSDPSPLSHPSREQLSPSDKQR